MTKGPPKEPPGGFFKGLAENWHDETCAEHDGTIAAFGNLGIQLDEVADYERLFQGTTWNWAAGAKVAVGAVAGAVITAPAAFIAAPGIATALGSWGILGSATTGTAISSLSGAALTNASLAAVGGGSIAGGGTGIAGGIVLLTAAGSAIGGVRGGVVANSYYGQVRGFDISKLPSGRGRDNVVFVNGFLQQKEQLFDDWLSGYGEIYPRHQAYGVNWESKTLFDLGSSLIGIARAPVETFMKNVVLRSPGAALNRLNPLHWGDILISAFNNPWHNAMAKAGMTGILLAEILSRTPKKCYTLMGHSLGSRVLFYTLLNLSMKRGAKQVQDVYLLGGAVDRMDNDDWLKVANSVSGKIYNCYSNNDNVLKYLYQGTNALLSTPIGIGPIELDHPKIVNVDCSDIVGGHMEYKQKLPEILGRIRKGRFTLSLW